MTGKSEQAKNDHQDLLDFLITQGHSEERAQQIAGNHPGEVREMIAKAKKEEKGAREK